VGKISTHQRRARSFIQRSDWESALGEMRHALNADSNNPATHNQMGDVYLRIDDVANACKHFEKAIELYAQLGLHNNAVALCRKVIRLAPSHVEVRYSLARLRFDQGLRADGVAAFNDYLENVSIDGEQAIARLEERCRSLLDGFPDTAPVGKILEKLESVRSFRCAFEIVQRLAQRAADAGDNDSARKYTEKMRSLRVLVEGSGGGDLFAEAPPVEIASPRVMDDSIEPPTIEIDEGGGDPFAPFESIPRGEVPEPPQLDLPEVAPEAAASATATPESLDEPLTPTAPAKAPAPALPRVAPPDLDGALDDLLQDRAPGTFDTGGSQPRSMPQTNLDLDFGDVQAGTGPQAESAFQEGPRDRADDGVPEYEIPEASLEDLASMLEEDPAAPPLEAKPDRTMEPPRIGSAPIRPVEQVFHLGATHESDSAPAPGSTTATPAQQRVEGSPHDVMATGAPDPQMHEKSASGTSEATTEGNASRHVASPDVRDTVARSLREPVWIPDPNADPTAMPNPGTGQVHELEDVIETFRDQMAKALGNDASARYDLGVAYYEMGLYNEALSEFEAAVQDPRYREQCLELMAACLAMQGRHREIVAMLSPLLESSHANDSGLGLRYTMGVACEALGLRDQARRHFEQIARIDSSYRDVQARLMRC